jgi:hypothetical protein
MPIHFTFGAKRVLACVKDQTNSDTKFHVKTNRLEVIPRVFSRGDVITFTAYLDSFDRKIGLQGKICNATIRRSRIPTYVQPILDFYLLTFVGNAILLTPPFNAVPNVRAFLSFCILIAAVDVTRRAFHFVIG